MLQPTLEPEATIPPGKGVITPSTAEIASTAASAAITPAIWFSAKIKKFPPATPALKPKVDSTKKSPDIIGIECIFLPSISNSSSNPSPKNFNLKPVLSSSSASSRTLNAAVVGAVKIHIPILSRSSWSNCFLDPWQSIIT